MMDLVFQVLFEDWEKEIRYEKQSNKWIEMETMDVLFIILFVIRLMNFFDNWDW